MTPIIERAALVLKLQLLISTFNIFSTLTLKVEGVHCTPL